MGIVLSDVVIIETHLVENLSVMPHAKYLSCQIEVLFKSKSSTLHFHFFLSLQFYRKVLQLKGLTRAPIAEANARLLSLNVVKGHDFVPKPYRVMSLGQIAAPLMVNVH